MKILTMFLKKEPFRNFAIQELLSLLSMYKVPIENIFKHEEQITAKELISLNYNKFKNFPYVIIEIDPEFRKELTEIIDRAVSIARFVELIAYGKNDEELIERIKENEEVVQKQVKSDKSYAFLVKTHLNKISREEQLEKIKKLKIDKFEAKCDLKNPERVFVIAENYSEDLKLVGKYFGIDISGKYKRNSYVHKYRLPNRLFLGPTSTDENLAFLMVNQAQVKKNSFVLDPFSGTGSILISASHFGAICFGGEIDLRVLQGWAVGNVNKKSEFNKQLQKDTRIDAFINYKTYGLEKPDLFRADSVGTRFGIKKGFFDAIVCDPPYGIRASIRSQGNKISTDKNKKYKPEEFQQDDNQDGDLIQEDKSCCYKITKRLFEFADHSLIKGGRLVFLYPCTSEEKLDENFFCEEQNFKLIALSENVLSKFFSRFLVTFEKIN